MIFRSFRRHNAKGDKGLATSRRRPVFFRPWVEQLETRILLSAVSWMSNQSGFWDVGSNWSTGQVPSATDDVTINVPGITVTVRDGRLAHSLQCQDALVLSAGGLTLGADSEMDGPLTLGNATLTTNGVLTLTGNDTWSAGTVTGSGSVANQGTLNLTGSGESLQVILNNTGTITQTGSGSLNVSAALNLLSAGIYDLQADSGLTGGGTLTNAGLLKKSAGSGTSTIGLALNNTGVVEADSGTLSMSGTISQATSSALTGGSWTANNATLDLASAPNLTANQGTVTLSGPNSVFSKINGLTSNGGRLSILAGQNFIAAGDFTNSGIVTVGTGALQMSGHAFTNQAGGLLDLQNDNAFNGASQVSNAGTFRKSGGAGTLLVSAPFTNQNGTLDVRSGTLAIASTTAAGVFTGGTFSVASNSILQLGANDGIVATGSFTGSGPGQVQVPSLGTIQIGTAAADTASFNFPKGMFVLEDGSFLIGPGKAINTATGFMTSNGGGAGGIELGFGVPFLFENAGTLTVTGTSGLDLRFAGTTLQNDASGIINFQGDVGIASVDGQVETLVNSGTLEKSAGSGTSSISVPFSNQAGTINVQTGTLFIISTLAADHFAGATFTVASGSVVQLVPNAGIVMTGNCTGSGGGQVQFIQGAIQIGTTANDSAMLNFSAGSFQWQGGAFAGPGTLTNAGDMQVPPGFSSQAIISNSTFINTGTMTWQFAGLPIDATSQFINRGTVHWLSGGVVGALTNDGTGTMSLEGPGSRAFAGNSTWINKGTVAETGGTLALGALGPAGGSTGTLDNRGGAVLTVGPLANWINAIGQAFNAGTMNLQSPLVYAAGGPLANLAGGVINVSGTVQTGTNWPNAGTVNVTSTGNLALGDNTILQNQPGGILTFAPGAQVTQPGDTPGSIANAGLLQMTGGPGNVTIPVAVSNTGTVEVDSGILTLSGQVAQLSGTTLSGGSWNILNGARLALTFTFNGPIATNNSSVVLSGAGASFTPLAGTLTNTAGSLSLLAGATLTSGGNLTNSGTLTVGAGSTLSVAGSFTQTGSGIFNEQVGGLPSSGLFGQINATGSATLGGTFNLTVVNGFGPAPGESFPVMSFPGGHTGNFAMLNGLAPSFTAVLNVTNFVVNTIATAIGIDLAPSSITPPATGVVGQNVMIPFQVHNQTPVAFSGSWTDSLYLSSGTTLDPSAVLIGRVPHAGGIAASGTYNAVYSGPLPGIVDGNYHVLVVVDSGLQVPDSNRAHTIAASPNTILISVPVLTLGGSVSGMIANGQDAYYRIDISGGQDVVLTGNFALANEAELYERFQNVPTQDVYDQVAFVPNQNSQQIQLQQAQAGHYYLLLHGREGAAAGQSYTLTSQALAFGVRSVGPSRAANLGPLTITVTGAGFTPATTMSLIGPNGTPQAPTALLFRNANTLYATFDLTGVPLGSYRVVVSDHGLTSTAAQMVQVTTGSPGMFEFHVSHPANDKPGATTTITIDYENVGNNDVPAPIMLLTADNATLELPEEDNFPLSTLFLLATNPQGPAGVLPPGAHGTITVQTQGTTNSEAGYHLDSPAGLETIDWGSLLPALMPPTVSPDAYNAIVANFMADMGNTYVQFQAVADRLASYLSQFAVQTVDAMRMVRFELELADNFGTISNRYQTGALGFGWPDPTHWAATTDPSTGDVTITDANTVQLFAKQPDGSYQNFDPVSTSQLFLVNGTLQLLEKDGTRDVFRPDGLWSFTQDPNGNRYTGSYDSNSRLVSITDPYGQTTTMAYNAQGNLVRLTDIVGRQTIFSYDASGQQLLSVTDPTGTTSYTYLTTGTPAQNHAVSSITFPDGTHEFFQYDARGRLAHLSLDGGASAVTYAYDGTGRALVTDAFGATSEIDLNDVGQVAREIDALGSYADLAYDSLGRLVGETGPLGPSFVSQYQDANSSLHMVGPDGENVAMTFSANFANLLSLTGPAGNTDRLAYDSNGNLVTETAPDGSFRTYAYDSLGQTTQTTDRAGHTVRFVHDAHGLLTEEDLADGSQIHFAYDAHQNQISASGPSGTTTMTYDAADRMTRISYPNGTSLQFTYDAAGQPTTQTDQTGFMEHFVYDALGRLAQVDDGNGHVFVTYTYDAIGRLKSETLADGSVTQYFYDAVGQLVRLLNLGPNGAVLSQFQLAYDALGEVRSVTSNDGVTNYNYDGSGQLISAMLPNGQTISYQYDADGNRISETDASGTTTYQSNVLDQYLTAGSLRFSYDANGNMIRQSGPGGDTAYSYDLLGNLVGITTPTDQYTFTYDALGNRIGSTHNGQTVRELVDPALSQMVAQFNSSGTLIAHYVEAIGPTERIDSSGMTSFYHFDPFGNTGQITDSSGTIQDSYSYLPFGEKSVLRQVTAQPFTFSGQYGVLDDGAGTYFMRNRWYDPRLGRFLQPDPIGISGGDTNLYRYAGNRVPGQVDPGGTDDLSPEEVFQLLQQFNRNKTKFFGLQPIKNPGTWANTMDYKVGTTVRALGQTLQDAGAQSIPPDPGSYGANLPWNQTVSSIRSSINTIQKLLALQGKLKGLGINELPTGPTSGGAPDGSIPVSTVVGDGVKNSLKGIGNTIANSPVVRANAGRVVKIGQVGQVVAVLLDGPTWQALTTNPTDSTNSGVYGNRTIEKKGHDHTFDDRAQAIVNAALHILCDILVGGTAAFLAFVLVPVPGLNFVASVLAGLIAAQLCWFIVHLFSHDPNAIVGPAGYGDSNYVNPAQAMPYTVQFENQSSATAPAQTVTVTEHLDPNLDGSTFQLGDMGFGNFVIHVPAGLSSFSTRVDATATLGVFVDIRAGLDLLTGVITWIFTAIDPTTLDVPLGNPLEGFLPPDDSTGRGEGFVSYFVRPKATDKTGTVINAQATVVFDQNAPINTVQIFNTIDALPPSSSVNPLPAVTNAPTFTVSWSGMDDVGGSGIAYFDVFVSTDNGPFVLFLLATTQTSATFNGSFGHSYAFFSVAADHVGNRQPFPNAAQAITTVGSSAVIATAATGPFTAAEGQTSTVQTLATFTDPAGPQPPASYSVQVDWGDGNGFISDTNVTLAAPVNGVFTVSGSHRYVEEDGLSGQVKVKVMHAGTASNTVSVAVQVSDPAVIAMKVAVNAPAGAPFSGAVATFTDPGGAEANDGTHYTATLNWGDNTPATTGALAVSNGTFTVSGTHTYAAAGSYTISLTINHEGVPTTLQNPVSITTVGLPIPAQMTKPTSWWAGLLGQELIRRLGLTSGGQTVGQWLAMTLPNLYGGSNGAPNLSGFTNAQVAIFYLGLFTQQNTLKLDAQVLATALEVFATTQSLGGTTGQQYGFLVNAAGLGAYNVNIGFNGAAFGVPNSTIQNVYQVLLAANHFAIGGEPWGSNSLLRNEGFSVFLSINGG